MSQDEARTSSPVVSPKALQNLVQMEKKSEFRANEASPTVNDTNIHTHHSVDENACPKVGGLEQMNITQERNVPVMLENQTSEDVQVADKSAQNCHRLIDDIEHLRSDLPLNDGEATFAKKRSRRQSITVYPRTRKGSPSNVVQVHSPQQRFCK